jgi:hypothetical protein
MKELIVSPSELSLVKENTLTTQQLKFLTKRTPEKYVRTRPAKGGGVWKYVTAGYTKKCLNLMFGWDWDFEILDNLITHGEAVVKGKLTVRCNGKTIVKMQFGNKDIVCRKNTEVPLSIGNDLKSAASDALKKCASDLGLFSDVYNSDEFRDILIEEDVDYGELEALFELKKDKLSPEDFIMASRIITNKEIKSFNNLRKILSKL